MSIQTPLLPTLHALLPTPHHTLITSRLSLQSIHTKQTEIQDDIYISTNPIMPGQYRTLRFRSIRSSRNRSMVKGKGKGKEGEEGWEYSLTYLSHPLSGREYQEMRVQACIGLDVVGLSKRGDIEDFIEGLGFRLSHSYTQKGLLFHIPLLTSLTNPLTLNLTITRLTPQDSTKPPNNQQTEPNQTSEPYFVQLQPSRPVLSVVTREGDMSLADVMNSMRGFTERVDGIDWGTGR